MRTPRGGVISTLATPAFMSAAFARRHETKVSKTAKNARELRIEQDRSATSLAPSARFLEIPHVAWQNSWRRSLRRWQISPVHAAYSDPAKPPVPFTSSLPFNRRSTQDFPITI